MPNCTGLMKLPRIRHWTATSASRPVNQLTIIQKALRAGNSTTLLCTMNHTVRNTKLKGIKDSFVSAPSTQVASSIHHLRKDRLQKRPSRKNPSPASTEPTNLVLGTQKFTIYKSAATKDTG